MKIISTIKLENILIRKFMRRVEKISLQNVNLPSLMKQLWLQRSMQCAVNCGNFSPFYSNFLFYAADVASATLPCESKEAILSVHKIKWNIETIQQGESVYMRRKKITFARLEHVQEIFILMKKSKRMRMKEKMKEKCTHREFFLEISSSYAG